MEKLMILGVQILKHLRVLSRFTDYIFFKSRHLQTLALVLHKGCSRNVRIPPWEGTFFSTPLPIINNFHLTLPPTITHFIVLRRPTFFFIRSTTHKQQYFFLLHAIVLINDKKIVCLISSQGWFRVFPFHIRIKASQTTAWYPTTANIFTRQFSLIYLFSLYQPCVGQLNLMGHGTKFMSVQDTS